MRGEKSLTLDKARKVKMVLKTKSGEEIVLKPEVALDEGDIIDSHFMSRKALCDFYEQQIEDAYKTGVMFSLHVKATMMKVSPPHRLRPCGQGLLQGRVRQAPEGARRARRQRQQRDVRSVRQDRDAACVAARGDHPGHPRRPRAPPRVGHGRFGTGHHELPLTQRRDRRRLDAGDDPARRQDVRRRRADQGHQGGQPRVHVLAHLPGDDQLL